MMSNNKTIYGVYFISCIHNYLDIVNEQLNILNDGLLDRTHKLIIFITNYNENECGELDKILNNEKFILVKSSENLYEKFAINNYKNYITHDDYYLYYFHTKGVSRYKKSVFHSTRQILNYYILKMYQLNIELLEQYNAVGCEMHLYPKKHFSGNFWWSKSQHLKNLPNINNNYLSPEMYVLDIEDNNSVSLANNVNNMFIENYIFPDYETIKQNITTDYIIYEPYKREIVRC